MQLFVLYILHWLVQVYEIIVQIMFTVVALDPVTCQTNGTGSQLSTVNKKRIRKKPIPNNER